MSRTGFARPSQAARAIRAARTIRTIRAIRAIVPALGALLTCGAGAGPADGNPYQDPAPLQATHGIVGCPPPVVRSLTPEQARMEAHQRVERGTSCWLEGRCPAGGDYKDDDRVNRAVAAAIAGDERFAGTSVWVVTLRKFVTLQGCIADAAQGAALTSVARAVESVRQVWLETRTRAPPP